MGKDEQKEEREVLDSIFPDEIQDISDTEYRISISLDVSDPSEEEEERPPPVIILNVRYPDAYPDEPPALDITQPPNAAKHQHLDIQEDKARLLDSLQPMIEESMGMAMVFTLVSTLKDAAELLIAERQQAVQAVKDVEKQMAEDEENRKFEGEKVTRDSFLAWHEKFKLEMAEEKARKVTEQEAEEKKKRGKTEEKKLTGKQLWVQGLAGNVIEEDEEGEDAITGMRDLKVEG
ncbi:Protein gir2 [Vermiconidia calcicola]|uniref:Protein gir2 n=1 Tax=Vermiconidia calcicola TaxID=1690605 RepID=A0ACC3NY60_9PEZI|nr:Protein gir2 [Vermiconidia calcicola]